MKKQIQRFWRDEQGDSGAVGNVMRIAVGALIVVLILVVGRFGVCAIVKYANDNVFTENKIDIQFCSSPQERGVDGI